MTQKSRRDFIRASSLLVAGGAVTGPLSISRSAHAAGRQQLRIGLVGCGRAGGDAVSRALENAGGSVTLVAMADAFGDRLQASLRQLKSRCSGKLDVPRERRFVGLQAYRQLLALELELVVLATPPAFRPLHFEAAVRAGKHVFLETPVAVDPLGARHVMHTGRLARQQGVAVAAGLPHRHAPAYQQIMHQVREGRIGAPILLRVYRNGGTLRSSPRHPRQSEMEYQLRNWRFFSHLSGEPIVERHVGSLDVGNWLLDDVPVSATALGGRCAPEQVEGSGGVSDHFFCEFVYRSGARMYSQCRRLSGCWNNVSEHVHGAGGRADISGGKIYDRAGSRIWMTKAMRDGRQCQQQGLIAALRDGLMPNETAWAVQSTLTALMGRQAAQSGRTVSWDDLIHSAETLGGVESPAALGHSPAPLALSVAEL